MGDDRPTLRTALQNLGRGCPATAQEVWAFYTTDEGKEKARHLQKRLSRQADDRREETLRTRMPARSAARLIALQAKYAGTDANLIPKDPTRKYAETLEAPLKGPSRALKGTLKGASGEVSATETRTLLGLQGPVRGA